MSSELDPQSLPAGAADPAYDPGDDTNIRTLPLPADKQVLVDRLDALLVDLQNIKFIVPDDTGFFSIEDDLVHQVRMLIEGTLELMRDLTEHYDAEEPEDTGILADAVGTEDDVLREIGAAISSQLASQEVANMAFIARTQLTEIYDALLTALRNGFIWVVASNADTGLRRAGKALLTLESTVREYEGLAPKERRWIDLPDSLEIRRVYSHFRRFVLHAEREPRGLDLVSRLESAALRIAALRDLKIYPFLRIYDRVPIRKLQKRMLAWIDLDPDTPGRDEDGQRLWSDLIAFAELLSQINQREELREHDRRTIRRIVRLMFESRRPLEAMLPAHLEELERLIGRDDELDEIILDPSRREPATLRAPLMRVLEELEKPFSPRHDALEGFELAPRE